MSQATPLLLSPNQWRPTPTGQAPPASPHPVDWREGLLEIESAHARLPTALTPAVEQRQLSTLFGAPLRFKLENQAPSGSFKIRGAREFVARHLAREARRQHEGLAPAPVVWAGSGNHSLAMGQACTEVGLRAHVVVAPPGAEASRAVQRKLRQMGVRIHRVTSGEDRRARAQSLARELEARYVDARRDAAFFAGAGTAAVELLEQARGPIDVLFVPVGSGLLLSAVASVFAKYSPRTRLIGVQSQHAAPAARAWRGEDPPAPGVPSVFVRELATQPPVPRAQALLNELVDDILEVEDAQVARAMRLCLLHLQQVVEGAGALGMAGALSCRQELAGQRVAVLLTGANLSADQLRGAVATAA